MVPDETAVCGETETEMVGALPPFYPSSSGSSGRQGSWHIPVAEIQTTAEMHAGTSSCPKQKQQADSPRMTWTVFPVPLGAAGGMG